MFPCILGSSADSWVLHYCLNQWWMCTLVNNLITMLQFLKTKQCNLASAKFSNKFTLVQFLRLNYCWTNFAAVTIHNQEDSAQADVKGHGKHPNSSAGIQEGYVATFLEWWVSCALFACTQLKTVQSVNYSEQLDGHKLERDYAWAHTLLASWCFQAQNQVSQPYVNNPSLCDIVL
jgi:hypothetical protein